MPSRACRAARTARSTSSAVPNAIAANGLPSDGSIIGSVAPLAGATQRLAMKCAAGVVTAETASGAFISWTPA